MSVEDVWPYFVAAPRGNALTYFLTWCGISTWSEQQKKRESPDVFFTVLKAFKFCLKIVLPFVQVSHTFSCGKILESWLVLSPVWVGTTAEWAHSSFQNNLYSRQRGPKIISDPVVKVGWMCKAGKCRSFDPGTFWGHELGFVEVLNKVVVHVHASLLIHQATPGKRWQFPNTGLILFCWWGLSMEMLTHMLNRVFVQSFPGRNSWHFWLLHEMCQCESSPCALERQKLFQRWTVEL